ncbi:DUF885 domain-containing protein [Aliikangiella marina]|uniref:DUF885 domain-containing protein n=1 Tax=Aliikangiella marina TaxID=1712262 RepID=A0A545TDB8_9GAMM|nr:DUF885 domain-containing protein [Aliikangiella marina]TQV75212.1 DUF885 domain-containing protein [Aliikangiella marina]
MTQLSKIAAAVSFALILAACNQDSQSSSSQSQSDKQQSQTAKVAEPSANPSQEVSADASAKANQLFEEIFMQGVMRSPMYQTFLGIKQDQDKWNDLSEERQLEDLEITKQNLEKILAIDESQLDEQTKISYRLMKEGLQQEIEDFQWRYYNYPVNQMFGLHSGVASLLINQHRISDTADAKAYIARLNNLNTLFNQLVDGLKTRAEKGIIAPKFVYPYVIDDSRNIISGAPFSEGEDSTLWADFKRKVEQLEIEASEKEQLLGEANKALISSVKPAYEQLIGYLEKLSDQADTRDGVWKFPNGGDFFNNRLQRITTTNLTSEQIHQIGLSEVERIHNEMRDIMKRVNYDGTLQEFFVYMRESDKFYYENTDEGKKRYLKEATAYIDNMKARIDELFITKPKADLIVKAVEPFREKSAGKAFYQQPSMDGTRPGTYYANLYDMEAMPIYQMEALAYHEGVPGHHMQIALAQELAGIPKFRKFGRYTAYNEGWGLYSELVPKEIGLYEDPYSDFGRLAMELWRACRLVVDTGIHSKKWTREQGIEYYVTNTPNAKSDAVKMVERHIVMPGQATAYKIGMNKIVELRENAKAKMGDKFDIREFHDVVLANGPVPLTVLEDFVEKYIQSK